MLYKYEVRFASSFQSIHQRMYFVYDRFALFMFFTRMRLGLRAILEIFTKTCAVFVNVGEIDA